jgi:hypothetical protein
MSSPLDPVWSARIEPVTATKRIIRRPDKDDEGQHREHSDETPEDRDEAEDDDGLHVDVLA